MIRSAVLADAPAVTALHQRARATYYPDGFPEGDLPELWLDRWAQVIARPRAHVLVCVRNGEIVGLASFRRPDEAPDDSSTVKLFQFHTDPAHWRRGIGTELHAACVEQWQADGMTEAVLEVHRDNTRAQAFYAAHGWRGRPGAGAGAGAGGESDDHHHELRLDLPRE
ncbi:GNAT family N-acetyltransferase [Streptomyces sp. VRA16 Mangrove soil]|uniref:GNAT family N-acetyltransferase n=1 Tax=Streptomyces sp. VRA16 Mangrove soil TaxID=2817434 RepID=UPI001A9F83B3|nr:GNAT family N-acetyltransferase [Streptomyces sp. VRA16 Mangrove soil]MBO1335240.1 GNAT family N-acetyltransferase [Streptomyces sp. VRA16 Mangrove soil]